MACTCDNYHTCPECEAAISDAEDERDGLYVPDEPTPEPWNWPLDT